MQFCYRPLVIMTITLIRHGWPAIDTKTRMIGSEFAAWLGAYDRAGIDPAVPPPRALIAALISSKRILVSPARRALESARMLDFSAQPEICRDAGEAPLPSRIICPIPLQPLTYTGIARTLWLLGWAEAIESKAEVQARAQTLAAHLITLAEADDDIALVGHGYMNRFFLGPALNALGWRALPSHTTGYWSYRRWEKQAA